MATSIKLVASSTNTKLASGYSSAQQAGFTLGTAQRLTLANTEPLSTLYHAADTANKADIRSQFMVGYIMGVADCNEGKAQAIYTTKATNVKAYDSAKASFSYHVIRPVKGGAKTAASVVASAAQLRAIKAMLSAMPGDTMKQRQDFARAVLRTVSF